MMIPNIIHFCWMSGDPYPELIQKCIDSWERKLPDYQIKCWNKSNFDINICPYVKEAYEAKKYAFVSDYVRLYALYTEGGIYLDSDIEVIKTFNDLLQLRAFSGFESKDSLPVAAWIFGSEKGNPIFKEFLDYYTDKHFLLPDGSYDLTPNPHFITAICEKHGLKLNNTTQNLGYITIFSSDYFCPYNRATESLNITENTYCIHYFNGSWIPDEKKEIIQKRKNIVKKYGKLAGYFFYGTEVLTTFGFKQFISELCFFLKSH